MRAARRCAIAAPFAKLSHVVEEGLERGVVVNKQIAEHNARALTEEGSVALREIFATLGALEPREGSSASEYE
eukprot:scaffold19989_cov112-Isochrysis_galbana.AAC.4